VVDKVINLKKTQAKEHVKDPVWNAITALSPEELEKIITTDQAAIIAEDRKLSHILEILDVDSAEFALEEDPETMRILQEMENAGETSSIGKDLDAVQSRLSKKEPENRQETLS
jgi:hypothetical protein